MQKRTPAMPTEALQNTLYAPGDTGGAALCWYVLRSQPRQEARLAALLKEYQAEAKNLLEVYCPVQAAPQATGGGTAGHRPLMAGYVFVLATEQAVTAFMRSRYPGGAILYARRREDGGKTPYLTVPEAQMQLFKDFNESYGQLAVVLERPYSDYAFNPKTGEPNDMVKVLDGPLRGQEGYMVRFRRERRIVFNMKTPEPGRYITVAVPDVSTFHVIRLHNAEADRQTLGTAEERAADLLAGMLQACGYGDDALPMLHKVIGLLAAKPLLADLRQTLSRQGHDALSRRIDALDAKEAALLLNLARHEHDAPGYTRERWPKLTLRPFLTPTPGPDMPDGCDETTIGHAGFTEIIRRVSITEQAYRPSLRRQESITTTYYAHIGVTGADAQGRRTLFTNWDTFLAEYFMTAGRANARLLGLGRGGHAAAPQATPGTPRPADSFRNYAPTLYRVLTGASPVRAVRALHVGPAAINALAITSADTAQAADILASTCTAICTEINSTPRLALWRRYLRTVWLHE